MSHFPFDEESMMFTDFHAVTEAFEHEMDRLGLKGFERYRFHVTVTLETKESEIDKTCSKMARGAADYLAKILNDAL